MYTSMSIVVIAVATAVCSTSTRAVLLSCSGLAASFFLCLINEERCEGFVMAASEGSPGTAQVLFAALSLTSAPQLQQQ